MVQSRTITLGVHGGKGDVVRASGGGASGDVIITYDRDENQATVVTALQKCLETLIERDYNDNPPT